MKTFSFEHSDKTYVVSLDWLVTRNMNVFEASQHINTDQIMLINGKRVSDFKKDYKHYKIQGGQLKRKAYLDNIAMKELNATWDDVINFAKNNMRKQFNGQINWLTPQDHQRLISLAHSGHAVAAYNIGCNFIKQNDDMAILALVMAHNNGHVGALYRLSGYLAKRYNYNAAITCLVIAADCGADIAALSIPHVDTMSYLAKAFESEKDITHTLKDLAATSRYSTARYLQLIILLLTNHEDCLSQLNDIIACPQNPPKKNELNETYVNRGNLLKKFFHELKGEITCNNNYLLPVTPIERLDIYKKIANKKEYSLVKFQDVLD
ncbi:hypothetical protein ACTFQ6_12020 [Aliivibrio fischeri]